MRAIRTTTDCIKYNNHVPKTKWPLVRPSREETHDFPMWTVAYNDNFHMCPIWHTMWSHAKDAGAKHAGFMCFEFTTKKSELVSDIFVNRVFLKWKMEKRNHVHPDSTPENAWKRRSRDQSGTLGMRVSLSTLLAYLYSLYCIFDRFEDWSHLSWKQHKNAEAVKRVSSSRNHVIEHFCWQPFCVSNPWLFFLVFLSTCVFLNISTSNLLMYKLKYSASSEHI